jgi:hypothetical protein
VESGFPVILSIDAGGEGHVLTVLGHTFNSDRWTPVARPAYRRQASHGDVELDTYISAVRYADHFVIVDDNLGVNLTLPAEALQSPALTRAGRRRVPKGGVTKHKRAKVDPSRLLPVTGLVLTPKRVRSTGYFAELVAVRFAKELLRSVPAGVCRWRDALLGAGSELVGRTLFQTRTGYAQFLKGLRDSEGHRLSPSEVARVVQELPDAFWVTEISLPDLLSANRHKLGDVLCVNDASRLNQARPAAVATTDRVVLAWLPGLLAVHQDGANSWQTDSQWSLKSHVPVIRGSPLGVHEW